MSSDPSTTRGFLLNETAGAKIERFHADGPSKAIAFIDFDGTMTRPKENSWDTARKGLLQPIRERLEQIKRQKVALLDGMTAEESLAFNTEMLEGFRGQPFEPIRRELAQVQLPSAVHAMCKFFERYGIPTIVCSAGVSDFIGVILAANNIKPSLIVATKLQLAGGLIAGYDAVTMTSDHTKHTVIPPERAALVAGRSNEIVIGDRMNDTRMASSADALFVRVGGPKKQSPAAYIAESFHPMNPEHYPIDILAGEDLWALNGQLHSMLEPTA